MKPVCLSKVEELLGIVGHGHEEGSLWPEITGISTDTRTLESGELFIAIRGQNYDGHQYIAEAKKRGAIAAVVERGYKPVFSPELSNFSFVEVDDTIEAYGRIAEGYRLEIPNLTVIGITGSNGKTTTKEFIASVAQQKFEVAKTIGNFNNQIGLPRTLLKLSDSDRVAVVEMGMNQPGEINILSNIAHPNIGVITNIGHAHVGFLESIGAIAWEKSRLIAAIPADGFVLLNSDDPFFPSLAAQTQAQILTVGLQSGDLRAESISTFAQGIEFSLIDLGGEHHLVFLPVFGSHVVYNALFGFLAGQVLGIAPEACIKGLAEVCLPKDRMEFREVAGLRFIADCYNANPESTIAAIRAIDEFPIDSNGKRIAILGKLGELGNYTPHAYKIIAEALAGSKIDMVLTVDFEALGLNEFTKQLGKIRVVECKDSKTAAEFIVAHLSNNDLILLKGSRSAKLETIFSHLYTPAAFTSK